MYMLMASKCSTIEVKLVQEIDRQRCVVDFSRADMVGAELAWTTIES